MNSGKTFEVSSKSMATCSPVVSPTGTSEQNHEFVCLESRQHSANKQTMLVSFLNQEKFCDVTLVCEEKLIFAHKVVLAMCSSYFRNILTAFEKRDPIIIFKDIQYSVMKSLIDFMYKGELYVHQGQVCDILQAAQVLKVNGLLEGDDYDISKCKLPRTDTNVTKYVNQLRLRLNKRRPLTGQHRKRLRRPVLKKRCLVKNVTDSNDSGADSTEELLKEAEGVFQQLSDVKDNNKALAIPLNCPDEHSVQGTDEDLSQVTHTDKNNSISKQSQGSREVSKKYSTSNNTDETIIGSAVGREDSQENESDTINDGITIKPCYVKCMRVNLAGDKENEGNIMNKEQNLDSVDDSRTHVSHEENERSTEFTTLTHVNDTVSHGSKDVEESTRAHNETNTQIETTRSVDNTIIHHAIVHRSCDNDDSQENCTGVVKNSEIFMNGEEKSIPTKLKLGKVPKRPRRTNKKLTLKVKKTPQADKQNVILNVNGGQSVNNSLPWRLEVDALPVDSSHEMSVENARLRRNGHRKTSNCSDSESSVESGRKLVILTEETRVHPNIDQLVSDLGEVLEHPTEEHIVKPNRKRLTSNKAEWEGGVTNGEVPVLERPTEERIVKPNRMRLMSNKTEWEGGVTKYLKLSSNVQRTMPKSESIEVDSCGGKKSHPDIDAATSISKNKNVGRSKKRIRRKIGETNTTRNLNEATQKKIRSTTSLTDKECLLATGVIPMPQYLEEPGKSEQLFWKEPWANRIIQTAFNKKLGQLKASVILGVDVKDIKAQICLKRETIIHKPLPHKPRARKRKVSCESTDYDIDQDSETSSNEDKTYEKNVKQTVEHNSQPVARIPLSKDKTYEKNIKQTVEHNSQPVARIPLSKDKTYEKNIKQTAEHNSQPVARIPLSKDKTYEKNVKQTVKHNSQSVSRISLSDFSEEDSDFSYGEREPFSFVSKTSCSSIKPTPLTCALNLEPGPIILQTSEYSDEDASEELSGPNDRDLNLT